MICLHKKSVWNDSYESISRARFDKLLHLFAFIYGFSCLHTAQMECRFDEGLTDVPALKGKPSHWNDFDLHNQRNVHVCLMFLWIKWQIHLNAINLPTIIELYTFVIGFIWEKSSSSCFIQHAIQIGNVFFHESFAYVKSYVLIKPTENLKKAGKESKLFFFLNQSSCGSSDLSKPFEWKSDVRRAPSNAWDRRFSCHANVH